MTADTRTVVLALSPRAAVLVLQAVRYERYANLVEPDELAIFRAVTAELERQLGETCPHGNAVGMFCPRCPPTNTRMTALPAADRMAAAALTALNSERKAS